MPRTTRPGRPTIQYTTVHLDPFLNGTEGPPSVEYTTALRAAFDYFRRNAEGRYSDSTLMSINRSWDIVQYGGDYTRLPHIVKAEMPFTYDEETEVKTGGVLGYMLLLPEKAIMAVAKNARRAGVGTSLWNEAIYHHPNIAMWVGRGNQGGHIFCLTRGMFPTAMNGTGAVRYATSDATDE